MTHISAAATRSRRVAARHAASNVPSSRTGTFSLLRSHRREAYSNSKQCIYLTACFFAVAHIVITSAQPPSCPSLPTTTSSPLMFLLGSAALFVNPQLAYFHDGHLLLINKAETFHLKGKRECGGGGGGRRWCWNCCERNVLRGVIIWCRAAVFFKSCSCRVSGGCRAFRCIHLSLYAMVYSQPWCSLARLCCSLPRVCRARCSRLQEFGKEKVFVRRPQFDGSFFGAFRTLFNFKGAQNIHARALQWMLSADKGNSVEVYNEGSVLSCSEELAS